MDVTLTSETQRLLERRMREGDYSSPDEVIRAALETFEPSSREDLDEETEAAIDRAEEQAERGEGIPLDEAFEQLRRKHFGVCSSVQNAITTTDRLWAEMQSLSELPHRYEVYRPTRKPERVVRSMAVPPFIVY